MNDSCISPIRNTSTTEVPCPVCGDGAKYEFSGRDLMFDQHERFDYLRCQGCGAVFLHPMPGMAAIAGFYPADYGIYDDNNRARGVSALRKAILAVSRKYDHLSPAWPIRVLAQLLSRFTTTKVPNFVPGGLMLDVGCGNGRYLATMRSLGWQVQGVEFSEDGVRACRKAGLPVHHGDLISAEFPDASFDLITIRHVIEHIPEPHPFIAEVARVLKPGGSVVVETPNSDALGRALLGPNWYANDVPRHLILYAPGNLALLAERHGLQKTGLFMDTSPKILLNSIDYAMGSRGKPSKRMLWRRFLARLYVVQARRSGRGDTILLYLHKP